ncbi:unnamed protein product, partial [Diamesa hyperborea]
IICYLWYSYCLSNHIISHYLHIHHFSILFCLGIPIVCHYVFISKKNQHKFIFINHNINIGLKMNLRIIFEHLKHNINILMNTLHNMPVKFTTVRFFFCVAHKKR